VPEATRKRDFVEMLRTQAPELARDRWPDDAKRPLPKCRVSTPVTHEHEHVITASKNNLLSSEGERSISVQLQSQSDASSRSRQGRGQRKWAEQSHAFRRPWV
jgi:hypothetical protein